MAWPKPGHALAVPTRVLLLGGVVGPILFVATVLVEGATRAGYDPIRSYVSVLSLGDGGWVQSLNFVGSGLLIAGFGLGLSHLAGDGALRWIARCVVVAGLALAWSGVFPVDPQDGYPVWISKAASDNPTWHARLHFVGGFLAATGLPAAILIDVRQSLGRRARARAAYGLASAAAMLGFFLAALAMGALAPPFAWAGLLQRAAIIGGFQWLAVYAFAQVRAARTRAAQTPGARARAGKDASVAGGAAA